MMFKVCGLFFCCCCCYQGNATLHLYPHFKPLQEIPGEHTTMMAEDAVRSSEPPPQAFRTRAVSVVSLRSQLIRYR